MRLRVGLLTAPRSGGSSCLEGYRCMSVFWIPRIVCGEESREASGNIPKTVALTSGMVGLGGCSWLASWRLSISSRMVRRISAGSTGPWFVGWRIAEMPAMVIVFVQASGPLRSDVLFLLSCRRKEARCTKQTSSQSIKMATVHCDQASPFSSAECTTATAASMAATQKIILVTVFANLVLNIQLLTLASTQVQESTERLHRNSRLTLDGIPRSTSRAIATSDHPCLAA